MPRSFGRASSAVAPQPESMRWLALDDDPATSLPTPRRAQR
jgi:hypothetical protein